MRKAIVVLGMHRSGTSMVSGLLKLTGLDLGKNLVNPDHANIKGYFENDQIGQFNDRLFGMIYANWNDTLLLPDQWWMEEKIVQQIDHFVAMIRNEFDTTSFMLLKDPRISVLLPFYLMAFDKMNIKPYFIINFRDPYEVAASLKKRDNLAISKGLILWMDHTLKAELFTRGQQRIFIQYDQVLANPLLFLKKIFHHFNLEYTFPPAHSERINEFVEKEMKHQSGQSIPDNYKISAEVEQLFDLLRPLNGKDTNGSSMEKFDKISSGFYSTYKFYHGVEEFFEAVIQIETTSRVRKTSSMPIHIGHNQLDFVCEGETEVTRIILNPCNQRTGLIIHKVMITGNRNDQFEIHPNYSNADWSSSDGTFIFESDSPEITYILGTPKMAIKISFDLTYIATARGTHRFGIHELKSNVNGLAARNIESEERIQNKNAEIDTLLNRLRSGTDEIMELKTNHSQKEEEYSKVISFCQKEIDNMAMLIAKNEEAFQAAIKSGQGEIERLNAQMAKNEEAFQAAIKSGQGEVERLIGQMAKNEALSNLVVESKQNEIHRLSSDIQSVREEWKQTMEIKELEVSRLHDDIRKQELTFANMIDGIKQQMNEAKENHEQEIETIKSHLAGKENELSVMLKSYTWRTGKLILSPAQFFLKKRGGD